MSNNTFYYFSSIFLSFSLSICALENTNTRELTAILAALERSIHRDSRTTASRGRSSIESPMIVAIGSALLERYFSRWNARVSKLPEIKPRSHEAAVRGSGHDVKEVAQRPLPLLFIRSPIQSPV